MDFLRDYVPSGPDWLVQDMSRLRLEGGDWGLWVALGMSVRLADIPDAGKLVVGGRSVPELEWVEANADLVRSRVWSLLVCVLPSLESELERVRGMSSPGSPSWVGAAYSLLELRDQVEGLALLASAAGLRQEVHDLLEGFDEEASEWASEWGLGDEGDRWLAAGVANPFGWWVQMALGCVGGS